MDWCSIFSSAIEGIFHPSRFVCLTVLQQDYLKKNSELILMKPRRQVRHDSGKNPFDFGGDMDLDQYPGFVFHLLT